jgi:hypothetical protein
MYWDWKKCQNSYAHFARSLVEAWNEEPHLKSPKTTEQSSHATMDVMSTTVSEALLGNDGFSYDNGGLME